MKLLMIDDQINVISSLKEAVSPAGIDCVLCEKPEEALKKFKNGSFDVVVTDYQMPEMNGIEVLKEIQRMRPGTPVIILTGYADVGNAIDAVNHGAYAFFQKPVPFKRFLATLTEIQEKLRDREIEKKRVDRLAVERDAMLKEIHHRVRNNLQFIRSLIKLHTRNIQNEDLQKILTDIYNRVFSLSLVQERVYQFENFEKLDFALYAHELTSVLLKSQHSNIASIYINTCMDPVFLDIETAIPCGLIVNELVTNSLQHAFPGGRAGEIRVLLKPLDGGVLELTVSDNGIGIPESVQLESVQTMGLYLVKLLAENQLDGIFSVQRHLGTESKIVFRERQIENRIHSKHANPPPA
jgi:two-component sensor histidine kinase